MMDEPSQYELGKTLGEMEGHLKSIDDKLQTGSVTMKEIKTEQSRITGCVHNIEKDFASHKEKPHLHHITDEETKWKRFKRHKYEIGIPSVVGIVGLIWGALEYFGVI